MSLKRLEQGREKSETIFRSIFSRLFLIMLLQAAIFYFAAVYGGIEESLTQNAADVLSERLNNRKYEIETLFTGKWTELDLCRQQLDDLYRQYEQSDGSQPLARDAKRQVAFLRDSADTLINTLRHNEVNGVFLILNDHTARQGFSQGGERKYGLCIRDMDPDSNYTGTDDLQLERAPSSIVDALGCRLDSWWEPKYTFQTPEGGDYYYAPLSAAWQNPDAEGDDLAYISGEHHLSGSDPSVVSYSVPLLSDDGYPYGVIGVELTTRYIASLLPSREINDADKSCYVLAMQMEGSTDCQPIVSTGAMYSRCFGAGESISIADASDTGGFWVTGRGDVRLYGDVAQIKVYNNNNPFDERRLVLMAMVEGNTLFAYTARVKLTLMIVALISLVLGVLGITLVSRRFAAPITALARRVRGMRTQTDFHLDHIGVNEIDLLVDSIEELNRNVSKNSARTEFFSRMSHDMRTPMNAIISFSSPELLSGATEATKDDYLQKIHASGEFLLALINEVLDMTKIESNKTELRLSVTRASRLCETVIPIIRELAQKKNIFFSWKVDVDDGVYVSVDEQHLNQIVMNLLSNAVKFTPEGGSVSLSISEAEGGDAEHMLCQIAVKDAGVGMSEDFLKNLYTPFEQENARLGGTGLGLSIAKKLVELMGGDIACESRLNAGTTFTVTLPLPRLEPPAETESDAERAFSVDSLRGKRILVCEDNAINTQIIVKLLESKGVKPIVAADGQEGLEKFAASEQGSISAILMDIRMPVLDGLAATRLIRALGREDAATVPIVAMTANAFEADVRASHEAGMNEHLAKPIEPTKLFDTLARLIG